MIKRLIGPNGTIPMLRIAPIRFDDVCFVYAPHPAEFREAVLRLERPRYYLYIAIPWVARTIEGE